MKSGSVDFLVAKLGDESGHYVVQVHGDSHFKPFKKILAEIENQLN